MAKRVQPVKPADIESFYSANQERLRGSSLDDVRQSIAEMLRHQRREAARTALLSDLRKSGPDVRIALDPPRHQVAIASTDPVRGARSAPVTIVEFSDYQCPFCARLVPVLAQVLTTYGDRVSIVWKDFPLEESHPRAAKLAEAARCAGDYGKYWEFHDRVFANQAAAATTSFEDYARSVGLPAAEFAACVNSGRHAKRVTESLAAGNRLGVDATPTLFINGRVMAGAEPFEVLARIIDDELARGGVR
jgi:protein-disulfide isomerase